MAIWQEVKITINRNAAEGAYALLEKWGIETYAVDDVALIDQAQQLGWGDYFPPKQSTDLITITIYFSSPLSQEKLERLQQELANLGDYGFSPGNVRIAVANIKEEDWAHAWKEYYTPQRIGRILIQPSWLALVDDEEHWDMVVYLDPGMAFGSGTHPTTSMCIEFLQDLNLRDRDVWDIGTGSGILGIVAAKYGAKVRAVDVDPVAVKVTRENQGLNNVEFPVGKGSLGDLEGKPQLIVANIVANVIAAMLPEIHQKLDVNGYFIASGVIESSDQEILSLAAKVGFRLLRRVQQGEWVSYLFQKGE